MKVFIIAVPLVAIIFPVLFAKDDADENQPCTTKKSVCASLFKYDDEEDPVDQGQLCKCAGCTRTWTDGTDLQSLTWYHQERRDFIVQYRLCGKVISDKECSETDNDVIKVTTGINEWKPIISDSKCHCPGNIHYLLSWWKRSGRWEYLYGCQQPQCKVQDKEDPCFKQYMLDDKDEENVNGFSFPCGCPDGYKCSLDQRFDSKESMFDETGHYVPGYCQVTA